MLGGLWEGLDVEQVNEEKDQGESYSFDSSSLIVFSIRP